MFFFLATVNRLTKWFYVWVDFGKLEWGWR